MEDLGYPPYIHKINHLLSRCILPNNNIHLNKSWNYPRRYLSPYLFTVFLEPQLRWLEKDQLGSLFSTSPNSITITTYADDLAILVDNIKHIQPQLNKLKQYSKWAHIELGINKCAVTRCPNKSKLHALVFITYLKVQNINYKQQQFPILSQK